MRFCSVCGARFSNDVRFCPHDGQPLDDLPEPAEPEVDPLLGQVLDDRYRIEEILGEGGMGVVYLATHVALNKRMALKVLQGDMAKDETVVARFIQEAQSSSAIGHPNIIDISDFGRLPDGTAYFVMELLEGESLTQLIQRGRMTIAEVVHVGEQIASALGAAHERGIVHRDLKPDNVQLIQRGNDDRFVKVLDFGIAKVGGASSKLTKTGMIFGTPHYMSPEQAAGQSVDARADIYALGVILYEMCTGSVPFDGDTFMGILSKHMFEEPPRPSELDAGGCALEPVVMRALAKKPEDRYPTMEALITDLRRVRDGGSVEAAPALGAAASPLGDLRGSMPELPSSRTPLVALGVLAGLLG
ncbi:MAG TPA: serine/threonine-protein kinase, partial [Polyangiaceae bacterium LLY-WYZ-15_(1-7)]|nr:serine/threonine-protein kinase [Polyangiaceae bacterium LLY-WYZ-15_(1-7)]